MKRLILNVILLSGCSLFVQAQPVTQDAPAKNYPRDIVEERNEVPNSPLREADVLYNKKVQRVIDTREKKNMVMNWPRNPFSKVLLDLATVGPDKQGFGEVKMYKTDSLTEPMTLADFEKLTELCYEVDIPNPLNPEDIYDRITVTVCEPFEYQKITRFMLYEEWIFDKQRGIYAPRIVAIAPLFNQEMAGVSLGEHPMFYVSFEELRPYLVNEEIFNRQNDVRQTYCDFFDQRQFSSYITKESNMYDYAVNQMPEFRDNPMEALYESERIRESLMNAEIDFWEY